jgi:hypothetical protein
MFYSVTIPPIVRAMFYTAFVGVVFYLFIDNRIATARTRSVSNGYNTVNISLREKIVGLAISWLIASLVIMIGFSRNFLQGALNPITTISIVLVAALINIPFYEIIISEKVLYNEREIVIYHLLKKPITIRLEDIDQVDAGAKICISTKDSQKVFVQEYLIRDSKFNGFLRKHNLLSSWMKRSVRS